MESTQGSLGEGGVTTTAPHLHGSQISHIHIIVNRRRVSLRIYKKTFVNFQKLWAENTKTFVSQKKQK